MVNGHSWDAECSRKLRFREEKFLNDQVRDFFNTRRLIDDSYLVGGIHRVQVKIKSIIIYSRNNSEVTSDLYCNLKQLFYCFLSWTTAFNAVIPLVLPFAAGHKFFIDSLPKRPQLSFLLSQCVNSAISQLASYDGYQWLCSRLQNVLFTVWTLVNPFDINTTRDSIL